MTHDEKIVEAVARAIAEHFHKDADFGMDGASAYAARPREFQETARAAITAYQAEAWQPRATLPRDATISVVVAATDKNRTFAGRRDVLSVYIDSEGQFENDPENEFWEIVLWQPLPAAPKATP